MFVSLTKYNAEVQRRIVTELELIKIISRWDELVSQINDRGGEQFLNMEIFDKDELSRLIQLCHPDKHNGSATATTLTTKLLRMRKSM